MIFAVGLTTSDAFAKVEFSGRASLTGATFLSDPPNPSPTLQKAGTIFEVEPVLQIPSDNFRFRLKGIVGWDYTYNEPDDRKILIPEEAFIEARTGKWNFLAGYNTFTWGVTDVLNPLDVINPRNYRNPFQPTKIGVPAVSIAFGGDSTAFELVFVPRQAPHALPPNSSRALPRDISLAEYTAGFGVSMPTDPLTFYYEGDRELGKPFDNNYGLRFRQTLGKLEAHLVGFEGSPQFPDLAPIVGVTNGQLDSSVGIRPYYQRVRVGGLGLVYSFDTVILRTSFAQTWRAVTDRNVSLPETLVVALEKSAAFSGIDWTFLLQYAQQKDKSGLAPSIYSLQQIFDGSIMPGVRMAYGVDFSMLFGAIYNPTNKALIATIDMQYRLSDQWQLKLGGVNVGGGKLLDAVKSASRLEAGLSYNW